ncbi:bile acid:sodium symporter family protein [Streptomyces sp. NPDC002742]|uniref:bile acid:sodium symporter family protein n=1 Tax=Streptomyces sp. NPDC002742 TaxID=3364663 RepID=UPI0036B59C30
MKRLQWPSWMPVDPYILLLLGTVGLAALFPASGTAADVASGASTAAIAFLFFLYGARLSTREAVDGLKHWRLHGTVLICTFVAFPLLGLAARGLEPAFLTHDLYTGLLFLTLVPSTIQSSIAFTSIARGNVPAAICAGSFSSLAGIVVTPLLAAVLLGNSGGGFSADSLVRIVLQLLVPFVAGQLLRPWIGAFTTRHKKVLGYVDRGSILLVVYTAFSEGMVQGIWHQVSAVRLAGLLVVEALLLGVMLLLTWYGAKALRFGREDRIAIQFAGSKKSLASGLPMAGVLFGAHASLAVLPLMLFHQMQLMVCAVIAKRRARDPEVTGGSGEAGGSASKWSAGTGGTTGTGGTAGGAGGSGGSGGSQVSPSATSRIAVGTGTRSG